MPARLVEVKGTQVKIELTVELSRSMLETEEAIQGVLTAVGCLASQEALRYFDSDGSALQIGPDIWRTKGQQSKLYQTPDGEVELLRPVYQRSGGGATYCPLEREARLVITSRPRFAKQGSSKFAQGAARDVQRDLAEHHARPVAVSSLQRLSKAIGTVVQAKETDWESARPDLEVPIASVAVGLDGTCLLMCEDGWREAMVGTIALFTAEGERQHTLYVAATPEYGKQTLLERLARELEQVKAAHPQATYLGLADGAEVNWRFLIPRTEVQLIDFYHASGYLQAMAAAVFPSPQDQAHRARWLHQQCHQLKHETGAAQALLQELKSLPTANLTATQQESLESAITYFTNHYHQMGYAAALAQHWPIGSGGFCCVSGGSHGSGKLRALMNPVPKNPHDRLQRPPLRKRHYLALCALVPGLSAQLPEFGRNDGRAWCRGRPFEPLPLGPEVHTAIGGRFPEREEALGRYELADG